MVYDIIQWALNLDVVWCTFLGTFGYHCEQDRQGIFKCNNEGFFLTIVAVGKQ